MLQLLVVRGGLWLVLVLIFGKVEFTDALFHAAGVCEWHSVAAMRTLFAVFWLSGGSLLLIIESLGERVNRSRSSSSRERSLTSMVDSRSSPSSSLSKSYGFFSLVVDAEFSLLPLAVRGLLCDDESDDCGERSRNRR